MFAWLKRLAAPVAAVALLAVVPSARAATIAYSAAGSFFSNGGSSDLAAGSALTTANGALTLQFTAFGGTVTPDAVGSAAPTLGFFQLVSNVQPATSPSSFAASDRFNLTISTIPLGSGSSQAEIMGSVSYIPIDTNSGTLNIKFDPKSVFIVADGVTYSFALRDQQIKVENNGTPVLGGSTLKADVTVVPLPATAWMGFALIGGLGGARGVQTLRRRRMALAA